MELQSLHSLRFHVFAPQWEAAPWFAHFEQKKNKISKESISTAFGVGGTDGNWISWVRTCHGFEVSLALALWINRGAVLL